MEFVIPNETATEQSKRLKGVKRKDLVEQLESTLLRVRRKPKSLPMEFVVQTRPLSTNKMSGRNKTYESKEYLEFRDIIAKCAGGTYGITGKEKLKLSVEAAFSNKRADADNCLKPLLDSMVGCMDESFDDSQVYRIEVDKKIVKKGHEYLWVRMEVMK